jgi:hypothetical protein
MTRNMTTTPTRRLACFMNPAGPGNQGAAQSLIWRAICKVTGTKRDAPHFATYIPAGISTPRFTVRLTASEFETVRAEIIKLAKNEGWERAPLECYYD